MLKKCLLFAKCPVIADTFYFMKIQAPPITAINIIMSTLG